MASIRADVEKTINEKYKASPEYNFRVLVRQKSA